jgi:hypothetical protein
VSEYAPGSGEDGFARSREAFAEIEGWLDSPQAAALDHAGLEDVLEARGRELLRVLLQDHLDVRAVREQRREQVAGADGITRTRAEKGHRRRLATVFGVVSVSRIAYRAPGAANVHPADAELNLPPQVHSHGLRKRAAIEAARGSFGQARAAVAGAAGVRLGKRQVQELTRRAAADVAAFYAGVPYRPPPGAGPGDVLALSCDAKGIIVLPGALRPEAVRKARRSVPKQDGRLSRGEVGHRKRMAETGAVSDFTPAPRTARDIVGPPGPGAGPPPAAPRARNKWVTASVADTAAEVVASVFAEADRRDPRRERTWIALADGNAHQIDRIRAEAAARGITLPIICDFIHVLEYLWRAAWCFYPEASPQAAPWVRARAAAVLRGHARPVAAAIRARITAAGDQLSPAKRRQAATTAAYLDAKAPWLDYPAALAAGWPISSGVIEGTCRYLVKDRMDITGARWGLPDAEAVLKIRALLANDDFDAYWAYHLQRERERNHPASYTLAA